MMLSSRAKAIITAVDRFVMIPTPSLFCCADYVIFYSLSAPGFPAILCFSPVEQALLPFMLMIFPWKK
jgi:hypothetical protein